MRGVRLAALLLITSAAAGCPRGGVRRPDGPKLGAWTAEAESAAGASFAGIAIAPDGAIAASFRGDGAAILGGQPLLAAPGGGAVVLARAGKPVWIAPLGALRPGPVAVAGDQVIVAAGGTGAVTFGNLTLRGTPGAVIAGLSIGNGATRWTVALGATDWVVVRAIGALPGGEVVAVGTFGGTMRAGDQVVTAAGPSDGFVVRVGGKGEVRWLERLGGPDADAVTAVAAIPGGGAVIGGSFTGDAELRGVPLAPIIEGANAADGFVARLGDDGAPAWATTFGGDSDDDVAGVAVNSGGLIGVATTLRGEVLVDDKELTTRGLADAAVLIFGNDGHRRSVAVIGGPDYDSASALAAAGDGFVASVAYAGAIVIGGAHLDAAGGDGALIAHVDRDGQVSVAADLAGPGRETVAALAATGGGWAAAIGHTLEVRVATQTLSAPSNPYAGAALVVRPIEE